MKTFVTLAIVLACKGLTAYRTNERPLVCVCAKMRTKIVCPSETLRTEVALECSRMLLLPATIRAIRGCALRVGKIEDVVSLVRGIARTTAIP
jgi:hypothetical protein